MKNNPCLDRNNWFKDSKGTATCCIFTDEFGVKKLAMLNMTQLAAIKEGEDLDILLKAAVDNAKPYEPVQPK